jgi:hypothetical protein
MLTSHYRLCFQMKRYPPFPQQYVDYDRLSGLLSKAVKEVHKVAKVFRRFLFYLFHPTFLFAVRCP